MLQVAQKLILSRQQALVQEDQAKVLTFMTLSILTTSIQVKKSERLKMNNSKSRYTVKTNVHQA